MLHSEHLAYLLKRFNFIGKRGIEIGVRHGDNAEYLLTTFPQLQLVLVDPYAPYQDIEHLYTKEEQDSICEKAHERLIPFKDRVTWERMTSLEAAAKYKELKLTIDFCFIDGEHTYSACKADIAAWRPLVKKNGIIAGHDFSLEPVKLAIRDTFQEAAEGFMVWSHPASDVWGWFK